MRFQWTRRRVVVVAAIAACGMLVAWRASRPERNPQFVGQWTLSSTSASVGTATISLKSDGSGTVTERTSITRWPVRWWTVQDAVYLDTAHEELQVRMGKWLRRLWDNRGDPRRFAIVELNRDIVQLKTSSGDLVSMVRITSKTDGLETDDD